MFRQLESESGKGRVKYKARGELDWLSKRCTDLLTRAGWLL